MPVLGVQCKLSKRYQIYINHHKPAVHHVSLRHSIPICSWFCRISMDIKRFFWHILVLQIRHWIIDGLPGLVNVYIANWKITMLLMGKSTISMAMFNSYVAVYQRVAPFPGGKRIFLAFFRVAEPSQCEKRWKWPGRPSHSGRWQSKCTLKDEKRSDFSGGEKRLDCLSFLVLGGRCFLPQAPRSYPIPMAHRVTPGHPEVGISWVFDAQS